MKNIKFCPQIHSFSQFSLSWAPECVLLGPFNIMSPTSK